MSDKTGMPIPDLTSIDPILAHLLAALTPVFEPAFTYFDVGSSYDVSLNVIDADSRIAEHVHDVDVLNLVLECSLILRTPAGERTFGRGEWISLPKGESHAVATSGRVVLLELWAR